MQKKTSVYEVVCIFPSKSKPYMRPTRRATLPASTISRPPAVPHLPCQT
jgi:hypothetical protein